MKIEHIALNVADPASMAEWWAFQMGMRVVVAGSEPPYMHFIADDNGTMIELYNNPSGAVPDYAAMSPYALHIAFTATDMKATRDRLMAAGATAGEITTTPTGDQLLFLRDPWHVPFQMVKRKSPLI